jgi:hypothetical protein
MPPSRAAAHKINTESAEPAEGGYHVIRVSSAVSAVNRGSYMEKKRLGNTDLFITQIGLGAWAMGGGWAFA